MAQERRAMGKSSGSGEPAGKRKEEQPVFTPRTDIYETSEAIVVVADMPDLGARGLATPV